MSNYFLDTSAILNGALKEYLSKNIYGPDNICYISPLTLQELENIKTSATKNEDVKYHAREAARTILYTDGVQVITCNQRKVNRLLHKYNFLNDINDHRLICECKLSGISDIIFVTSDIAQYILAQRVIKAKYYQSTSKGSTEYCGWQKYHPNDEEMAELYSNPSNNILGALTNQFVEIYEDDTLKDVLFWDGNKYAKLKYHDIKNTYLGETVKPRNLEQKMAFHLLQNQDIKVKLLTSAWGGGKTMLALNYALEQIGRGNYAKLVFVRNNIIVAGTNDIGFLPGSEREKMSIWAQPLADHVGGPESLDKLMDDGIIEVIPLSHIRGRSIRNSIVICDECENMDDKLVTLLISRIEESSELIFCGDVAQIDNHKFTENNGIKMMLKNLAGDSLFGTVKLIKSERGKVARMCDRLRPPV